MPSPAEMWNSVTEWYLKPNKYRTLWHLAYGGEEDCGTGITWDSLGRPWNRTLKDCSYHLLHLIWPRSPHLTSSHLNWVSCDWYNESMCAPSRSHCIHTIVHHRSAPPRLQVPLNTLLPKMPTFCKHSNGTQSHIGHLHTKNYFIVHDSKTNRIWILCFYKIMVQTCIST